jgi:hypothetical protein
MRRFLAFAVLSLVAAVCEADRRPQLELILFHSQHCFNAQVVLEGVLQYNAHYTRSGLLAAIPNGTYEATLAYRPPATLEVSLPHLIPGRTDLSFQLLLVAGDEGMGDAWSPRYEGQLRRSPKSLPASVYLGASLDYPNSNAAVSYPNEEICRLCCGVGRYQVTENKIFSDSLLSSLGIVKGKSAEPFSVQVQFVLSRPISTTVNHSAGSFRSEASVWTESFKGNAVATYDALSQHLGGYTLTDRKKIKQKVLGIEIEQFHIIEMPSGYKFWNGANPYPEITEYRPDTKPLFAVTSRITSPERIASAKTFRIETKSFIARMGLADAEGTQGLRQFANLGFDDLVGGRAAAFAFMKATDALFSEDPSNGARASADFRLWSSVEISVDCAGDRVKSWNVSKLETEFGKEGPLQAEGRTDLEPTIARYPSNGPLADEVLISYRVSGRPNLLALPAFNSIRPRECSWIWHEVTARLQCRSSSSQLGVALNSSAFPSQRLWINGKLMQDIPQGKFDQLWACDPNRTTYVW